MVSYLGESCFLYCTSLTYFDAPILNYIPSGAFNGCTALTNVSIPLVSEIGSYAFFYCRSLSVISLPNATYIGGSAFVGCADNLSVYLTGSSVCQIGITAFSNNYKIYVPSSLYSNYYNAHWQTSLIAHIFIM